jgi:LSD1 subclass zinc finger protein
MTDASPLRSMRCPNCGAPLDLQPGQSSVRCRFCDSVIEHSTDAVSADDRSRIVATDPASTTGSNSAAGQARRYVIKIQNGMPVVIESGSAAYAPSSTPPFTDPNAPAWRSGFGSGSMSSIPVMTTQPPIVQRSSRLGLVLALVIAAIVMCAVVPVVIFAVSPTAGLMVGQALSGNWGQVLGSAGTLGARILLGRSGTLVSGVNDGPPEAIMLTTQYPASGGNKEVRLLGLNTGTHKVLWQTAPLNAQLNDTPIMANADFAFIVDGQHLMAIHRTDGTLAWQATLADALQLNICRDCIQLVGTRLAALTTDGTLEVFDAATGQSLWKVTAKQDSPRGLYAVGQRIAFMDRNDVKGVLRVFDLDTGKESSAQPSCDSGDSYPDWTTPLFVAPQSTDVYMVFGSGPGCAQRWDTQNMQMVWSTDLTASFPGDLESLKAVFSADTIYLANSSQVLALTIDGGALQTLAPDPDYVYDVLSTHGSDVIVQAKRQRGTTRYEIWSLDGASGQPHWKFNLDQSTPLEAGGIIDDQTPVWTVQPSAAGLRVLRYQSAADNKSYKLLVDTLDWGTGQSAGQKVAPLNLDTIILTAPDWSVWKNDTLWMSMNDELLSYDAVQNKITSMWP